MRRTDYDYDIVIAGAGVAGASAAVALSQRGYRTLVIDPGLDHAKRLAGELIHPPGATDLAELGLLSALEAAGSAPIRGFAVFPDAESPAPADVAAVATRDRHSIIDAQTGAFVLPYIEVPGLRPEGVAIEHNRLVMAFERALGQRTGITLERGARVTAVDLSAARHVDVTIARSAHETRVRAGLLVGADGRTSTIRRLAGIREVRERPSMMVGVVLRDAALPHPGFGHIFVGGPAPILAYAIGERDVRVMCDVPNRAGDVAAFVAHRANWASLPQAFRAHVDDAFARERPIVSANYTIVPEAVTRGRLVLVGDAGGCCHPLTATGLSVCTRDAMRLSRALASTGDDIGAAIGLYERGRRGPQRTRIALASALYEAFASPSHEMHLLRKGILHFWATNPRGRAASMALLSTHDGRMSMMARLYGRVVGAALWEVVRGRAPASLVLSVDERRAALGLMRETVRHARGALAGILDEKVGYDLRSVGLAILLAPRSHWLLGRLLAK